MADDNGKDILGLLKCLKKFDGRVSKYPDWAEHTRSIVGMYRPNIERVIEGNWDPQPTYQEVYDADLDDVNEQDEQEQEEEQDEHDAQDEAIAAKLEELEQAKTDAESADQELETASKAKADAEVEGTVPRSKKEAVEAATNKATHAHQILELMEERALLLQKKPSAKSVSGKKGGSSLYKSDIGSKRRVIINQDEIDAYQYADSQLYKLLLLTLTDAASFVLKRYKPVDGSSGSGIEVWQALREKYAPSDEAMRRKLERELEALRMEPNTDPEVFINKVWYLSEQINYIGGNITNTKRKDIVLNGLPDEYEILRFNAGIIGEYDLREISDAACKLWANWTRNDSEPTTKKHHKSSARDSGMTAIYMNNSPRGQRTRGKYKKKDVQCYNCQKYGHMKRDCPERSTMNNTRNDNNYRRSGSSRNGRQDGARPRTRQQKWCSLHRTHLHDDSECFAQKNGRNNRAARDTAAQQGDQDASTTQALSVRESRQSNWARNSNRNNTNRGAHVAQADRSGPTEETVVEGYCGNLGFPMIASLEDNEEPQPDSDRISLLVDSGASDHYLDGKLIPDLETILDNYTPITNPFRIIGAGGHVFYGVGEGIITAFAQDMEGQDREVRFKCFNVPGLGKHLFSTGTAQAHGATTVICDRAHITLPAGGDHGPDIELQLRKDRTLYYLDLKIDVNTARTAVEIRNFDKESGETACTVARPESVNLWHRRLAHCHEGILRAAADIEETGVILTEEFSPCRTCKIQKSTQNNHPKTARNDAEYPCQRIFTDLLGPINPTAKGGYRYVSKFTDEVSRMNAVYLIKTKDEALDTLIRYNEDIVIPNGFRLEQLRSDCGGEYTSKKYRSYCKNTGIQQQHTAPHTPQQNGISERAGRTLMNIVRCMLDGGRLPHFLWGELCCTAVYITNRLPHARLNNETPYYRMFGKQASLVHLRVIGARAFVHVELHQSKLEPRAWEGKLVGYSPNSRAYRVYNPITKKIVTSRNVTFIEPVDAAMPPASIEDEDNEEEYLSDDSSDIVTSGNQGARSNEDFLQHDTNNGLSDSSSEEEEEEDRDNHRTILRNNNKNGLSPKKLNMENKRLRAELRRLATVAEHQTTMKSEADQRIHMPSLDDPIRPPATIPTPTTYREAMESPDFEQWKAAMDKEMNSLKEHDVADLVPIQSLPPGAKPIGSRWLYKIKATGVMKARLIVQGWGQRHGIDCGGTYAPVSRFSSQLILLAIAAERGFVVETMDVVTAFLQSKMEEEVYVRQAKGYEIMDQETGLPLVMKLKKSLYGLKQSPRNWGNAFANGIREIGFRPLRSDPCLYYYGSGDTYAILGVYVDDCSLAGKTPSVVKDLKKQLSNKFRMTDGGPATLLLGMEISQRDGEITVSQHNYILTILKKFEMEDCKPVATPGTGPEIEREPEDGIYLDESTTTHYRAIVGSLLFLTNTTRFDIGYSVLILCRGMQRPTNQHLAGAKRVLRYLKGCPDLPIKFRRGRWYLHGYCDANFAASSEALNKRSTSANIFILAGGVISASATLQKTCAQSSLHAELVCMATAAREAIYLQGVLSELGFPIGNIPLHSDSTGALRTSGNSSYSKQTKFMAVKHFLLKERVEKGDIVLKYIRGEDQPADMLTKHLARAQFSAATGHHRQL